MGRGAGSYIRTEYASLTLSHGKCVYCNGLSEKKPNSIDHIFPLNKGGNSELTNLTCACALCNSYKSAYTISEFTERIIGKRVATGHKLTGYVNRLHKSRKRNKTPDKKECDFQLWLSDKIRIERKNHTYFSSIINSLINQKYIIHG